jgi:hypothetical protein
MTSTAACSNETDCVPLPGFYGAPAQLSPADHYSAGGSRTEEPIACGANLRSLAGSAAITDCGKLPLPARCWLACVISCCCQMIHSFIRLWQTI